MDGGVLITVFVIFFALLAIGLPIAFALIITSVSVGFMLPHFPAGPDMIFRNMVVVLDSTPFLAIPLFIFSGNIMAVGGISEKLFNLFSYFLGNKTGGLPAAVIVTAFFFGSFTGSAPATVAAVGAMTIPILVKLGYEKVFVVALVTVASGLAIIVPPSVPMVVYGMTAGASIGDLFIAGIVPALLVAIAMIIFVYFYYKIKGGEDKEMLMENYNKIRANGFWPLFKDSFAALMAPVIILGGIYGGITTPTEAANIAVVYALLISVLFYRSLSLSDIPKVMMKTASTTAVVLAVISTATVFGRVLTLMQAPQQISAALLGVTQSEVGLLFIIVFFLLVVGMFMEPLAAILITTPIFLPIVTGFGMTPIHFGIIMIFASAMGFVTPPVGMSLFVASSITKVPLLNIAKKTIPFLILFMLVMLVIMFVPAISHVLI